MQTPKRIFVSLFVATFLAACGASPHYSGSGPGQSVAASTRGYSAPAEASAPMADYGGDSDDSESYDAQPSPSAMGMAPAAAPSRAPGQPTATSPSTPQPVVQTPPTPQSSGPTPATDVRRPLLIYRATIHLAVFEARKSIDEVENLAKSMGGYLVERSDMSITVRVPAGSFDNALETVAKVGDELHRQVQVQDVTAQFRDLQIRMKNLEAVRTRLAALLDRAKTVEEALRVERELERVAGNIESIKGQLKLFSELVAFSTITVNFQARPAESISSEVTLPFPWLNRLGLSRLLDLN